MEAVRDRDVEALFGDDLNRTLAVVRVPVEQLVSRSGPRSFETSSGDHPLPDHHQMSPRRVATFLAGRAAARQALSILGHHSNIIPIGPAGNPIWPAGTTGSITHTDTVAYAVVAETTALETTALGTTALETTATTDGGASAVLGLGLDVEHRRQIEADMVSTIMTPREHDRWAALDPDPADRFATMVFTAKEALYKAQFPLTGKWLGFEHVEVLGFAASGSGTPGSGTLGSGTPPTPTGTDRVDATFTESSSSPLDRTIERPLRVSCLVGDDQVISAVTLRQTTIRARSR